MARPNQIIEHTAAGMTVIFLKTARQTDGALLQMDVIVKPKTQAWLNDLHVHPKQEEHIQGISGQVIYMLGGQFYVVHPGETLSVQPGTPHYFYNGGKSDAHFQWEFSPALETEFLLETLCALAARGRLNRHGRLSAWQAALLAHVFRNEERSAILPWFLQGPLLALLAPLARSNDAVERLQS